YLRTNLVINAKLRRCALPAPCVDLDLGRVTLPEAGGAGTRRPTAGFTHRAAWRGGVARRRHTCGVRHRRRGQQLPGHTLLTLGDRRDDLLRAVRLPAVHA